MAYNDKKNAKLASAYREKSALLAVTGYIETPSRPSLSSCVSQMLSVLQTYF